MSPSEKGERVEDRLAIHPEDVTVHVHPVALCPFGQITKKFGPISVIPANLYAPDRETQSEHVVTSLSMITNVISQRLTQRIRPVSPRISGACCCEPCRGRARAWR
jgi:hypothetical protein